MKRLVSLVAMLAASSVVGWGYTINLLTLGQGYTLYNTGVNNSGVTLVDGAVDPHYTVSAPSASPSWTDTNTYAWSRPEWRSDLVDVRWITPAQGSPSVNGAYVGVPATTWYYSTNFTLPDTFPNWNVTMSALVWADNEPKRISLMNGSYELASVVLPTPSNSGECGYVGPGSSSGACGGGAAYSGGPFSLSFNGLYGGQTYSIRFEVINQGSSDNPAGLWVQWQSASAEGVPEPGTYALMGTVGLALYLLRRRKTAAKS